MWRRGGMICRGKLGMQSTISELGPVNGAAESCEKRSWLLEADCPPLAGRSRRLTLCVLS